MDSITLIHKNSPVVGKKYETQNRLTFFNDSQLNTRQSEKSNISLFSHGVNDAIRTYWSY